MLYNTLSRFAGCNLIEKSANNQVRLKIVKYWGELNIFIEYKGQRGHTIKDNIEPILEQITMIPELISSLEKNAINKNMSGDAESDFFYYCELEEPFK